MANVRLEPQRELSTFRRIAIGTWKGPHEAQVHGSMTVRMDRAVEYLNRWRDAGQRVTVTHLVARAAAAALAGMPEANALMRFRRIYLRQSVDIFLQVVREEGGKVDLSGMTLRKVDTKSVAEIAAEMEARVARVRETGGELEKGRSSMRFVPLFLVGWVLKMMAFVGYTLNLRVPGFPRDPFGSIMITNIGSLGLDTAYVPLVPYSRVPIILAMGAVRDEPVVDDGKLAVGKVMRVHATFDHRFIDGFHASVMARTLTRWLEDPEAHFGPVSPPAALPPASS
jgi:pyruvate dehydrogenase E2 component (dihydrolipoamide acetyltransferase)